MGAGGCDNLRNREDITKLSPERIEPAKYLTISHSNLVGVNICSRVSHRFSKEGISGLEGYGVGHDNGEMRKKEGDSFMIKSPPYLLPNQAGYQQGQIIQCKSLKTFTSK